MMDMAVEVPGETDQGSVGAASIIYGTSTGLNVGGSTGGSAAKPVLGAALSPDILRTTAAAANLKNGKRSWRRTKRSRA